MKLPDAPKVTNSRVWKLLILL